MTGLTWAQTNTRAPHIGYLYPAGGQRGTEVTITAGGQNLRGGRQVIVSGTGVKAEVMQFCPPLLNLGAEERQEIQRRFREAFIARFEELTGKPLPGLRENRRRSPNRPTQTRRQNPQPTPLGKSPPKR